MTVIKAGILFCVFCGWIISVLDAAESQCIVPLICNGNPSWVLVPNKETFSLPQDPTKERGMCNELVKQAQDEFNAKVKNLGGMIEEFQKEVEKVKMSFTTVNLVTTQIGTISTPVLSTLSITSGAVTTSTIANTSEAATIPTTNEATTMSNIPTTSNAETISTIPTTSKVETIFSIPTTSNAETMSTIPTTSNAETMSIIPTTGEEETWSTTATTAIPTTSNATTHVAVTCAGFQWNETCFWVNVTAPVRLNYTEAAEICEQQNSHLANIYNNSTHYDQVMTYLRPKIPNKNIWIGMTFDPSTKVLSLYNGATTNYEVNWRPEYPVLGISYTQMVVHVDRDPDSANQGLWNQPPSANRFIGVLCEIAE